MLVSELKNPGIQNMREEQTKNRILLIQVFLNLGFAKPMFCNSVLFTKTIPQNLGLEKPDRFLQIVLFFCIFGPCFLNLGLFLFCTMNSESITQNNSQTFFLCN